MITAHKASAAVHHQGEGTHTSAGTCVAGRAVTWLLSRPEVRCQDGASLPIISGMGLCGLLLVPCACLLLGLPFHP